MRCIASFSLFIFVLAFAGPSGATGIIDPALSYATSASGRLEIAPDGSGPTLEQLGLTITVVVLDQFGEPIPGYPWQDIWVHDAAGATELSLCLGGSTASGNTDDTGTTTITGAISGGGNTNGGLQVYLSGTPLQSWVSPPLDIVVTSADFDGDLRVDLDDLTAVPGGFANLFLNGSYDWQGDLNNDDDENIIDVVRFALLFLGQAECP